MSFLNSKDKVLSKRYLLRDFTLIGGDESFEDLYYFKGRGNFFK